MAKIDFVRSVRCSAILLNNQVATDNPRFVDVESTTDSIQRADVWLIPKSVEGFERSDFADLPPDESARLENSVREFLRIASDKPAEPKVVTEAQAHFVQIILILQNKPEWKEFRPVLRI